MKAHCHHCGRMVRLWETRCPYCHQVAIGWQRIVVIAAVAMTAIVYLLKFF